MVLEEISFEKFQDGRHHDGNLGYRNGTILAILNLCVTVMLTIKFWLNPTYGLGGDVFWRISRWPPWYRNGTFLAILNLYVPTMHPIKFRLNLTYGFAGDIIWRISRWPLGYRNGTILAILNLWQLSLCYLPSSFGSIWHTVWEEMSYSRLRSSHLGYRNETILEILNLCVTVTPPIKFQLNWT